MEVVKDGSPTKVASLDEEISKKPPTPTPTFTAF